MKNPTRRTILKGSMALGASALTTSMVGGTALAGMFEPTKSGTQIQSTKFSCQEAHQCIGSVLDDIIESPDIDNQHAAAAMKIADCPFCKQLVAPIRNSNIFATS